MADLEEAYVVEIDPATIGDIESAAAAAADGTFYLYECGDCGKRFTAEEFSNHTHDYVEATGEEMEVTDGASMVIRLPHSTSVELHDLNEENRAFQCSVCQKPFMQASNLKRHMRTHTGEKPFRCSVCARQFTQGNNLKAHMRIHSGERPFSCSYCDQKFTQGSNLRKHERSHLQPGFKPEKRFGCAQCGLWFVDYSILKAHIRVHTKEKPFACTLCDARFSQESNLRRHHRTHTGERPFKCPECGKQFSQGNNLKAHMIVHTGEKPLTCPTCGARFSRASKYQQHYRDVHLSGGGTETESTQYVDEAGNIITLDGGTMIDESGAVIKIISSSGSTATIIREGENGTEEQQVVEIVYEAAVDNDLAVDEEAESSAVGVASVSQSHSFVSVDSGESISVIGSSVVAQGTDDKGQQYVILESVKQEIESDEEGNEAAARISEDVSMSNQGCDSFTVGTEEVSVAAVCEVGVEGSDRVRAKNSLESRGPGHRSRKRTARSDYVYE